MRGHATTLHHRGNVQSGRTKRNPHVAQRIISSPARVLMKCDGVQTSLVGGVIIVVT